MKLLPPSVSQWLPLWGYRQRLLALAASSGLVPITHIARMGRVLRHALAIAVVAAEPTCTGIRLTRVVAVFVLLLAVAPLSAHPKPCVCNLGDQVRAPSTLAVIALHIS